MTKNSYIINCVLLSFFAKNGRYKYIISFAGESIMSIKNNDELIAQTICEYEKSIAKIILLCVDNL